MSLQGEPISEVELDLIRTEQEIFMQERISITRSSILAPGREESILIKEDVPCSFSSQIFGMWRIITARFEGIVPIIVSVPYDIDIRPGDLLTKSNGDVLMVRWVKDLDTFLTQIQLLAEKVSA